MPKKFMTMCEGGVVRSVCMALVLKHHEQDAVALSYRWNSPEMIRLVGEAVDYIVVMQPHFADKIPEDLKHKVRCVDVGLDVYHSPTHAGLYAFINDTVEDWKSRNWEI